MKRPALSGIAAAILALAGLGACPPIETPIKGRLGRVAFELGNVATNTLPCMALGSHDMLGVILDGDFAVSSAQPDALGAVRAGHGAQLSATRVGVFDINVLDLQGELLDVIAVCVESPRVIDVVDVRALAGGPRVIEGDTVSFEVQRSGMSGRLAGHGGIQLTPTGEITGEMLETRNADAVRFVAHGDGMLTLASGDASLTVPVTRVRAGEVEQAELSTVTCVNDDSRGSTLCGLTLRATTAGKPIYRPTCSFMVTPAEGLQIVDNNAFSAEGDPEHSWELFSQPGTYEVSCRVGDLDRTLTLDIKR